MATRVDLAKATERAWRMLGHDLRHRIEDLAQDGVVLQLDSEHHGRTPGSPYVLALRTEDGPRAEASSNANLHPKYHLDDKAVEALLELGWREPEEVGGNFWLPIDESDDLAPAIAAHAMVAAMRSVFGVPHPAFLADSEVLAEPSDDHADPFAAHHPHGPAAVFPSGRGDLKQFVEWVLTEDLGSRPEYDEDGDIPFVCGDSVVYVRVVEGDAPVVRIFSHLVRDVSQHKYAASVVNELNRDVECAKFVLAGKTLVLRADLPAYPFAPEHLRTSLATITSWVAGNARDVAYQVGGRLLLED